MHRDWRGRRRFGIIIESNGRSNDGDLCGYCVAMSRGGPGEKLANFQLYKIVQKLLHIVHIAHGILAQLCFVIF